MPKKARISSSQANSRVILFLGSPGSGKGTQSACLSSRLRIPSLSTGDMLRSEAKRNTARGRELRDMLASGSLVSDDLVCDAVAARLKGHVPENGVILDGFPRTLRQAECLDELLAAAGIGRPIVLHLHVSPERLLERLTARRQCEVCGTIFNLLLRPSSKGMFCEVDGGRLIQRDDDSDAVILRRLTEYAISHAPLVRYYNKRSYYLIDGDREADVVSTELLQILTSRRARAAA